MVTSYAPREGCHYGGGHGVLAIVVGTSHPALKLGTVLSTRARCLPGAVRPDQRGGARRALPALAALALDGGGERQGCVGHQATRVVLRFGLVRRARCVPGRTHAFQEPGATPGQSHSRAGDVRAACCLVCRIGIVVIPVPPPSAMSTGREGSGERLPISSRARSTGGSRPAPGEPAARCRAVSTRSSMKAATSDHDVPAPAPVRAGRACRCW
jgi:hypothetical protein